MSWQILVTVFTLGGIGAVVRGAIIFILALPSVFFFPFAVLLVNILAAFLGGFIMAMALPSELNAALVIGMIGGLGTLSAFAGDLLNHFFDRKHRRRILVTAIIYCVITATTGVLCAKAGLSLGEYIKATTIDKQKEENEAFSEVARQLQESLMLDEHSHEHDFEDLKKRYENQDSKDADAHMHDEGSADDQKAMGDKHDVKIEDADSKDAASSTHDEVKQKVSDTERALIEAQKALEAAKKAHKEAKALEAQEQAASESKAKPSNAKDQDKE